MKVEKFQVKTGCSSCATINLVFKLDRPVDLKLIDFLKANGFNELAHFTKIGILYVDSLELIITGPIGSDRLQVRCKKKDCSQNLNNFEALLQQMG